MIWRSRLSTLLVLLLVAALSIACGLGPNLPLPVIKPPTLPVATAITKPLSPTAVGGPTLEGAMRPTETRPVTKPLVVKSQTFFISPQIQPDKVGYKVVIHNPDTHYAVENANFILTFFNSSNKEVSEPIAKMVMIGADDEAVIVGFAQVPDPADVTSMTVTLFNPGTPKEREPGQNQVIASKVHYFQGVSEPVVTAEISSTYNEDITAPVYSVLAYDGAGNVIGFGKTMGGPLPAGGTVPIEIPIRTTEQPETMELFFTPDGLTSFQQPTNLELVVEQADLITPTGSYPGGVGMILLNPDPVRMANSTSYTAAAYDAAGNVLSVCSDYVQGILFPGERLGFGCTFNLPKEVVVDHVQVFTRVTDAEPPYGEILKNPLTVDNINLADYLVTATVHNTLGRDLNYAMALIVGYDEDGSLAGYALYHLDTMTANESRDIEIGLYLGSAPVVRVEVFPVITQGTLW